MILTLECFLAIFIVFLIVVCVFLVKFLKEAALTMVSLRELTDTARKELVPALKSVNNVLANVSNMSNATNRQLEIVKKVLTTLLGASCVIFDRATHKGGFIGGLISGFNMFRKKRR